MASIASRATAPAATAEAVARLAERVNDVAAAAAAAAAAAQAAALIGAQLGRDIAEIAVAVASVDPVDPVDPVDQGAECAPLKSVPEVDRRTVLRMHNQGASALSTAAALNAAGSRAAQGRRWSAQSVVRFLAEFPGSASMPSSDLSERLARAERDLAEAQRLGGLGSWSWDIASDQVHWSDQMYRLFGVLPDAFEATYEGFLECVHPQDRTIVSDAVTSVFEGAAGYEFDHRVVHQDGEVRWLHARGAAVVDPAGAPIRLHGTVLDTTAVKLAQQCVCSRPGI